MPGATFSRQQSVGDSVITFPDAVNSRTDFDTLSRLLEATGLDKGDKQCLSDLRYRVPASNQTCYCNCPESMSSRARTHGSWTPSWSTLSAPCWSTGPSTLTFGPSWWGSWLLGRWGMTSGASSRWTGRTDIWWSIPRTLRISQSRSRRLPHCFCAITFHPKRFKKHRVILQVKVIHLCKGYWLVVLYFNLEAWW